MNQNKKPSSSNTQFIILLIIIVILTILAIFLPKAKDAQNNEVNNNPASIEVIESQGTLPSSQGVGNSQENSNSPQQNPATIQDLGGDNSAPGNIDNLLKDKEIELK